MFDDTRARYMKLSELTSPHHEFGFSFGVAMRRRAKTYPSARRNDSNGTDLASQKWNSLGRRLEEGPREYTRALRHAMIYAHLCLWKQGSTFNQYFLGDSVATNLDPLHAAHV